MKGTDKVLRTWASHSKFPKLTVIKHAERAIKIIGNARNNIRIINRRISKRSLLLLQNQCGVHLCPSKTEGFGHYIMEAMSVGAVVITTDAPPMNEFIKDRRCLVRYSHTEKMKYATIYKVDNKDLAKVVKALRKLSREELESIGRINREEYLRRDSEFKQEFEKLMSKAVRDLYGNDQ